MGNVLRLRALSHQFGLVIQGAVGSAQRGRGLECFCFSSSLPSSLDSLFVSMYIYEKWTLPLSGSFALRSCLYLSVSVFRCACSLVIRILLLSVPSLLFTYFGAQCLCVCFSCLSSYLCPLLNILFVLSPSLCVSVSVLRSLAFCFLISLSFRISVFAFFLSASPVLRNGAERPAVRAAAPGCVGLRAEGGAGEGVGSVTFASSSKFDL